MADRKEKKLGYLLVLGGLFIGMGVGMAIDKAPAGIFIGLGAGILASFVYSVVRQD